MAAVPDVFKSSTLNGIHLDEVCINDLQEHLRVGAFTSRDLTAFYLERIERVRTFFSLRPAKFCVQIASFVSFLSPSCLFPFSFLKSDQIICFVVKFIDTS